MLEYMFGTGRANKTDSYDVFISYGREYRAEAVKVQQALASLAISTWRDDQITGEWNESLKNAIQRSTCVLLLAVPRIHKELHNLWHNDKKAWPSEVFYAREQKILVCAKIQDYDVAAEPSWLNEFQINDISSIASKMGDSWQSCEGWARTIGDIGMRTGRRFLREYVEQRDLDLDLRIEWAFLPGNENDPLSERLMSDFRQRHDGHIQRDVNAAYADLDSALRVLQTDMQKSIQAAERSYKAWVDRRLKGEKGAAPPKPTVIANPEMGNKIRLDELSSELAQEKIRLAEQVTRVDAAEKELAQARSRASVLETTNKGLRAEIATRLLDLEELQVAFDKLSGEHLFLKRKIDQLEQTISNLEMSNNDLELKAGKLESELEQFLTGNFKVALEAIEDARVRLAVEKARISEREALKAANLARAAETACIRADRKTSERHPRRDGALVEIRKVDAPNSVAVVEYGVITWPNEAKVGSASYAGEISGLLPHGYGVVTYSSGGAKYSGQWDRGLKSGSGIYEERIGEFAAFWRGGWHNGEPYGDGVEGRADGTIYEGMIISRDGQTLRDGEGMETTTDSIARGGQWSEDRLLKTRALFEIELEDYTNGRSIGPDLLTPEG